MRKSGPRKSGYRRAIGAADSETQLYETVETYELPPALIFSPARLAILGGVWTVWIISDVSRTLSP